MRAMLARVLPGRRPAARREALVDAVLQIAVADDRARGGHPAGDDAQHALLVRPSPAIVVLVDGVQLAVRPPLAILARGAPREKHDIVRSVRGLLGAGWCDGETNERDRHTRRTPDVHAASDGMGTTRPNYCRIRAPASDSRRVAFH